MSQIVSCDVPVGEGQALQDQVRATSSQALRDPNPYPRGGACWFALHLGGFEDDLARLADDHTPMPNGGGTVADHIR